jgi:large subunit ribosomal protein L18
MAIRNLTGRTRRKKRIRKKIFGGPSRPRLTVFRSLRHIYAQIIDDVQGRTLVSASTNVKGLEASNANKFSATEVGKRLAERAVAAKIETVVFDRNGYLYHGCVKALADGAREKGLRF